MVAHVTIYRPPGHDCTAGGISSQASHLTVMNVPFAHGVDWPPDDDAPAAWLFDSSRGIGRPNYVLVPAVQADDGTWGPVDTLKNWYMHGGNVAGSGDSRWAAFLRPLGFIYPYMVAIHDRHEPWPT